MVLKIKSDAELRAPEPGMWPWCSTGNKVATGRVLLFLWLSPCRARGRCLGVTLVLPPLAEELHSQTPPTQEQTHGDCQT